MNSSQRLRTRLVLVIIICVGAVLVYSLYSTAVVQGSFYTAKADAQYARPANTVFDRGTIYLSAAPRGTGNQPIRTAAATIGNGYIVYMDPRRVRDAEGAYQAVSQYLEVDKQEFLAKAVKPNDPYEEFGRRVPEEAAKSIARLNIPGIGVLPEAWRSYPTGGLAAHTLGLVGQDASSNKMAGRYGLERYYDDFLSRSGAASSGSLLAKLLSDAAGSAFGLNESDVGDIVTTIEPTVERYLENTLGDISSIWNSDEVGGIIMDPHTGDIVAMASVPSFDPNNTAIVRDVSVFSNRLVERAYEMGSIMKPLTMAVALDAGTVNPSTTYNDVGCTVIDKRRICNYDQKARGPGTTMQQILSQSLNIGASKIAIETGAARFVEYFKSFGIGDKTGIDLPNEAAPLTGNLTRGTDISIATASYGQGVSVSPMGMARALAVLANGGYLVTPRLVKEKIYTDGRVEPVPPIKTGPVLKKETVDEVARMLVVVVDDALKAGAFKNELYTVAAKTGTASVPNPDGGYYSDRYLHSFFGFFPVSAPRFLVFIYHVNPKGAQFASETLAEPFDGLARFLLDYYDIHPDR